MTCRHAPGDPNCSSNQHRYYEDTDKVNRLEKKIKELEAELAGQNPDNTRFEIEEIQEVGPHLVAKIKYPNCAKCSYEGVKIMVFLNVSLKDVIKWRIIDPHFKQVVHGSAAADPKRAPSPAARFPGSETGWDDAVNYAKGKSR